MIKNSLKTAFLLATLSGLLFFLGSFLGGASGALIALVFSLIMNFGIYFYSDRIVLGMYGAQPLDVQQYPMVYATVKELAAVMKMPVPQLWLVSLPVPNAFATGRSPAYASIAFTREIITLLDHKELRGVIAHELSHIKNRDILIGTVAATVATAIGYIVQMIQHRLFWSSFSRKKEEKESFIGTLLIALFMPLASMLLQLAITRSREYHADETGAHACKDPLALASALEKIYASQSAHKSNEYTAAQPTASLFIASLFATHPPVHKRIAQLQKISDNLSKNRGKHYE